MTDVVEIALSKDGDGDYTLVISGASEVSAEDMEVSVEAAIISALEGTASMALGADIHRFWDEGWPKEYFHIEGDSDLQIKDTEGELTLDPLKEYDLNLMGYLEPHTDDEIDPLDFADAFLAWVEASAPKDTRKENTRYPSTYSYDFIREYGPHDGISPLLSRSDASQLVDVIAKAMGVGKVLVCERLADVYLASDDEIIERSTKRADAFWTGRN